MRPTTRLFCACAVLASVGFSVQAQNFGGVKVGDNANAVVGFQGQVALGSRGPDRFAKFRMPGGHELSLTTRNFGPIIYMESNRDRTVPPASGPGVHFGRTTRRDLVDLLGHPGFSYANRKRVSTGQDIVIFHSYELANQPGVVATFAFLLTPDRFSGGDDAALLDAVIVAQSWYLDEIWGGAKTAEPGYAPVTLQY